MAKAVIWVRTSTEEQEIETQRSLLTEKAKKDNYKEDDLVYIGSAGASAIKMNELYQREVNELIGKIQADADITAVYVWEVSRLARNELAFYQMKDALTQRHIQLVCDVPSLRLLDEDGEINSGAELSLNLLVTLAKQEMTIKKKRMSRGKKRLAEQGRYNGGAIPYGYKKDPSQDNLIVIDEDVEGPIVREIYNMYEHGKSQPEIAKELFERGVKGRAARSTKAFTISLVHQILTNELLTGRKHLNKGSSYERQYPQIITEEQFERCRKIADRNNKVLPKGQYVHYAHGIIKCPVCGRNYISTGRKGYYHCQDAYNYSKKYDGYYGEPMCPHKVCISTNIMDSLLWELTKDYESVFIMNSATQQLKECEEKKNILKQKIDAIPSLLADIDNRMEHYLDALAEGWSKEKFKKQKQKLSEEEKKIRASEAKYREQMAHYDMLIDDIKKSMQLDYNFKTDEDIDNFIDYSEQVRDKVVSITDDAERSRLIHKHIQKVTVTATTVNYKFGIHPEGKDAFAKEIVVYPYMYNPQTFVFIPNNGKGGVMLRKNLSAGEVVHVPGVEDRVIPEYSEFSMEYLPRIYDVWKRRRRELARAKREALESEAIQTLRKQGFISMNEMREISKLSYCTLHRAIVDGKMKGKNMFKVWYVKKKDFEAYLKRYKPIPHVRKQTSVIIHKDDIYNEEQQLRMQQLLDAIMKPNNE